MKMIQRHRILVMALVALLGGSMDLFAQSGHTMTVHVKNLTPETRDDITRQLEHTKEARILFACVPAGILVFESTNSAATANTLRDRAMPMLRHRSRSADITELNLSIAEAEEQCAQARLR